jgi:urea transport system permease protein
MKKSITYWFVFWVIIGGLAAAPLYFADNSFRLNLMGKFLCFAIVAIGLDLIWGYGGMLSLGQGLFFSLGGYAMAMHLKLQNSGTSLPDFMVWSGLDKLPRIWEPFSSAPFALAMVVLAPTVVGFVIGFFMFRSRVHGVYFSIITQAMTLIFSLLFIGQQPITGGTNGITDLQTVFGFVRADETFLRVMYLVTLGVLILSYLLCHRVINSRLGRLLVATRDDESRVRFLGHNPVVVKTLVFALSAGLAGLAGALYVIQDGIISPSQMGVRPSIEMVIWTAVGGRGTLLGGIVGALSIGWAKSLISENYPEVWEVIFGLLFLTIVLLLPKGIVGTIRDSFSGLRKPAKTEAIAAPEPAETKKELLAVD